METQDIRNISDSSDYPYGFESNIPVETIQKGLTEATIRLIAEQKFNQIGC